MACGYRMGIIGSLSLVPDGRTVTPINDVSILLQCAGIQNSSYTTLTEIFNDTGVLNAVINSNNAIDYLVRSTEFAKSEALVPTMTSNTTPSGECISNGVRGTDYANWKAFDGDNTTEYQSDKNNVTSGEYIGYIFTNNVKVGKAYILEGSTLASSHTETLKIQCSSDGTTWTDLKDNISLTIASSGTADTTQSFINNTSVQYYRVYLVSSTSQIRYNVRTLQFYTEDGFCDNATAMSYIGANDYASDILLANEIWFNAIYNSPYLESILNTKVPIMTSNTTPYGECFATGSNSGYLPYNAFDKTVWTDKGSFSARWDYTITGLVRIGYKFTSFTKVYKCVIAPTPTTSDDSRITATTLQLQGSNDGNTWVNISEVITTQASKARTYDIKATNVSSYKYYSVQMGQSWSNSESIVKYLQFYGRQFGGVQSWLLAAGITNKNYTTVSQVLADSDLLPVLIASHSGMDYLTTCVAFANEICANETAMQLIGADNYAADALLSNETWINAIANSIYTDYVLNVKVPTMTSNTTPEGVCIGDATNGTYNYQAFDDNDSSRCFVLNQLGKVLGYQFTSGCKVKKVFFKPGWNNDTFNVEGSNDGNTWNNIGSIVGNSSGSTAIVDATTNYTYYRVNQTTKVSASAYQEIYTVQFYGRQDV